MSEEEVVARCEEKEEEEEDSSMALASAYNAHAAMCSKCNSDASCNISWDIRGVMMATIVPSPFIFFFFSIWWLLLVVVVVFDVVVVNGFASVM